VAPKRGRKRGSLACVGVGMTLGSQLGRLARSYIVNADIVFMAVSFRPRPLPIGKLSVQYRRAEPDATAWLPQVGSQRPRTGAAGRRVAA
jgi:hypothetical protein